MLLVTVVPIEAGDLEIKPCGKEMDHLWFRNKAEVYRRILGSLYLSPG